MLERPASPGGGRRVSLPFSETGSLGDSLVDSPVVEFFRDEPPAPQTSWLGDLGTYFESAPPPPPPPEDPYADTSPPASRHDTPPLLMRHAPRPREDDESTASEASIVDRARPASPAFLAAPVPRSPASVLALALPNPPPPPRRALRVPQPRPTAWVTGGGRVTYAVGAGAEAAPAPRRLALTATATLLHLPAAPRAPPAVVRVAVMGPTLEQSATSMLLHIPAAARSPAAAARPPPSRLQPRLTAWTVGDGAPAYVGAAVPPNTGVRVAASQPPASPREPRGAPELPPTPVPDSPARIVEVEAPDAAAAARIVAAPRSPPVSARKWAAQRWNPATPTTPAATPSSPPPSGARKWAARRWNPADEATTPAETTPPPSGARKWAARRWNPATTPSFSEAGGDTPPSRRRRWSTPPQPAPAPAPAATPKRRSSSIKPSDAIAARIESLQKDKNPDHVARESVAEVTTTPSIQSRKAMLREASLVQKTAVEDVGLGVKWRTSSLQAAVARTAAPLIDAKSELRAAQTDGPSQLLRERSRKLEIRSMRAAYDERRRPERKRVFSLEGASVFTPGTSPPKTAPMSYGEISEGTVSSLSQNYNDLIARTLKAARDARERLANTDADAARRRRVQDREAERIRHKAALIRNACEQPQLTNSAASPWALRVDATCPTPGATLHVSLDGGAKWHTKRAVDSACATLSLELGEDCGKERVVLAYATRNGNAPSDVASMAFAREAPRYILHEAHPTELTLRGCTTTGKRCVVCGLAANDADDYVAQDAAVVVCKKCALAPLAARFKSRGRSLCEGEADPTKALCCVAVDAAAHRLWLSGPVHFEGNRAVIVDGSQKLLDQLAQVLRVHPSIAVRLEGHTNSRCGLRCDGSYVCANNRCAKDFGGTGGASAFSRRRAEAVGHYLAAAGVGADRVHAAGLAGSRRLVDDTEGHLKHLNRRVEVHTVAF